MHYRIQQWGKVEMLTCFKIPDIEAPVSVRSACRHRRQHPSIAGQRKIAKLPTNRLQLHRLITPAYDQFTCKTKQTF
jgi:hypothetical protein